MAGDIIPHKQAEHINRILVLESACASYSSSCSPSTSTAHYIRCNYSSLDYVLFTLFVPLVSVPPLAEYAASHRTMSHVLFLLCWIEYNALVFILL